MSNAHDAAADAAACLLLLWKVMRDHPSSFRRSLQEIEEWLISGEVRKDESELGRALTDLESLDKNGRIRIDEGVYIVKRLEGIEGKTCKVLREKTPLCRLVNFNEWNEDDAAREILIELVSSIRNG